MKNYLCYRGPRRRREAENGLVEIAENLPNLGKKTDIQVREERVPNSAPKMPQKGPNQTYNN